MSAVLVLTFFTKTLNIISTVFRSDCNRALINFYNLEIDQLGDICVIRHLIFVLSLLISQVCFLKYWTIVSKHFVWPKLPTQSEIHL